MALKPAVKNGVLIVMTKPSHANKLRAFDGSLPLKTKIGGFGAVTTASLLDGFTFVCNNPGVGLSGAARMEGIEVVLLGAIVFTSDGYTGVVAPEHCTGINVLVG